jgi:drug/metabolite transporter (DMT)-like permease
MKQTPGIDKSARRRGQGAVFLCAALWSTSGLFIKLVDWHPLQIAGARSFLAVLVILLARALRSPALKRGPARFHLPSPYVFAGGLAYAATMILFVIANKLTAPANAILLQYSAPVWAALLGWALAKEKPHWEHWFALLLVTGGLLLFFREGLAGGGFRGDCIAVISGVCFGANSVFMRMLKEEDPAEAMLVSHIITLIFSIPFFFTQPLNLSAPNLWAIVFMGIFQIGAASLLFSYGIKRITAIQAMLTAMIEPVLSPVWVLLITGERPGTSALIGGSVILAAVGASSLIGMRRDLRRDAAEASA